MSCEDETVALLKRAGHRLTPQRLMILTAVRHADRHLSANEILDVVKASYPFVDASTVYRTLGMFKKLRLLTETDLGTGDYSYEWLDVRRHHHLICQGCDGVQVVEHGPVADLGRRLEDEYGFRGDLDHFAIFGLCRECRATEAHTSKGEIEK